jgi:hypothetical protein
MVLAVAAGAPAPTPAEPAMENVRQFLADCDREPGECRKYLNAFILGAIKDSSQSDLGKCIPLGRNQAAEKMLGLMKDPELADWDIGNGLMQSLTDAFPCLTGH